LVLALALASTALVAHTTIPATESAKHIGERMYPSEQRTLFLRRV